MYCNTEYNHAQHKMQTEQKNVHIQESPKSSTGRGSERTRGSRKHQAMTIQWWLTKTRSGSSNCAQIHQRKQAGKRTGQKGFSEMELLWGFLETLHYLFQWTTRERNEVVLPQRVWEAKKKKQGNYFFPEHLCHTRSALENMCLQIMLLFSKFTAQSYCLLTWNRTTLSQTCHFSFPSLSK